MTKEEFERAGLKIWGREWKRRAAERFSVCERTIRYWASGTYPIPGAVAELVKKDLVTMKDLPKLKKELKMTTKNRKAELFYIHHARNSGADCYGIYDRRNGANDERPIVLCSNEKLAVQIAEMMNAPERPKYYG